MADWIREFAALGGGADLGRGPEPEPEPEPEYGYGLAQPRPPPAGGYNPTVGGVEPGTQIKTLGDHLAKALKVVQRDFWLEEWLQTNTPGAGVVRPSGHRSPGSSPGSSRPGSCPRSPHLNSGKASPWGSPPRSPPLKTGARSPALRSPSKLGDDGFVNEVQVAGGDEDIQEYGKFLGILPSDSATYLWIAECALHAPVPEGWDEYVDEDGDIFYHDTKRNKSTYEHPCDDYYRWMYWTLKRQNKAAVRVQRWFRAYRRRLVLERRLVRQTVRAIRLPAYKPPSLPAYKPPAYKPPSRVTKI
eukprot:SAG22_NODE_603_length_8633_cov_6.871455_5_plen_302_part_00